MELADIKGVGPKRIELLRQLGIESLSDLLVYYPSSYLDFSTCTPVDQLEDGTVASICVTLTSGPSWYSRKGLTTVTVYGRSALLQPALPFEGAWNRDKPILRQGEFT